MCCGARVVTDGIPNGEMLPANGGGLLRDHRCLFLPGTYALRRSLLLRVGPFDERLRFGENTDLGFRVVAALTTSGMSSACVDRPLITWNRDLRRTDRRDQDRLESAEHTLAKYASELEAMPAAAAALERIAAVNAARLGYARRARRHATRAVASAAERGGKLDHGRGLLRAGPRPALEPALAKARWLDRPSNSGAASPHPRVSVLMPVFNGGERIGRAVDSILDQTFTDLRARGHRRRLDRPDGRRAVGPRRRRAPASHTARGERRARGVTEPRPLALPRRTDRPPRRRRLGSANTIGPPGGRVRRTPRARALRLAVRARRSDAGD